jgi:type IV pilus assembly protein PilV
MRPGESERAGGQRGFTLIEVMIALVVLAMGMATMGAMQLHALRGGNSGRHATQAASLAKGQMEQLQSLAWSQLNVTTGWSAADTRDNTVQGSPDRVEMLYTVDWRISDLVAGWTRSIDVRVRWNDPSRPNRSVVFSGVRFNREGV